jgi:hypothetical protein
MYVKAAVSGGICLPLRTILSTYLKPSFMCDRKSIGVYGAPGPFI